MSEIKVLVVEVNELNAEIAKELLEELGVTADIADDGLKAIEMMEENGDYYYSLILMDIMMHNLNGLYTTHLIREKRTRYFNNIPIVAMTANTSKSDMKRAKEAGMDDFIAKPIDTHKLATILYTWIEDIELNVDAACFIESNDVEEEWVRNLQDTHFNASLGIKFCGTQETYKQFLQDFVILAEKNIGALRAAYNEYRNEDFMVKIHAIKSFTASLGNKELSELCSRLEKASAAEDRVFIENSKEEFLNLYHDSVEEVQSAIGEDAIIEKNNEDEILSVLALLDEIKDAAEAFDLDCVERCLLSIRMYNLENEISERIDSMRLHAQAVDFSSIIRVSEELRSTLEQ